MNTTSPSRRLGFLGLLAVAGALTTAACGPADTVDATPTPTASAEAAVEGVNSFGTAADPTNSAPGNNLGPTDLSPTYPGTTETYSKAVVTAWTQDQAGSLGGLTAPAAQAQILALLPTVNDQWTYLRCDGTAGSSYCSFTNANGDRLTLRISHALLGKAHAAIEASLDKTEYPADGVAYVKEFVGAWQFGNTARMLKLSTPAVVAKVKSAPVSPTYPTPTCCGGGLLQVNVHWATTDARFDVGTMKLGGPNAIVDYASQLTITS